MLIKNIKLENIRSYVKEEVSFPEGIILLSGDIGSGKTTLLLAIEFALFGITRGEVSGSALLRNGCDSGSVTLSLIINNKEIFIKRFLKRSTIGVNQGSCYLTIDDVTKELTPNELKQRVLELLNYPNEYLTKKSMIYRYTIYTPQDEMKSILLNDKSLRLETLRKVFNIDKYKRIVENSKVLVYELKSKKREYAAFIYDLEDKKVKLDSMKSELFIINDKLKQSNRKLNINTKELLDKKLLIKAHEDNISKLKNIKMDIEIILSKIKYKEEHKNKISLSLRDLVYQINILSIAVNIDFDIVSLKNSINDINSDILKKELYFKDITKRLTELSTKKQHSESIKNKVLTLDNCPMCEQQVNHNHKIFISDRESKIIENISNELVNLSKSESLIEQGIIKLKKDLEALRIKEKEYSIVLLKKEDLVNKNLLKEQINNDFLIIEKELSELNSSKLLLEKEVSSLISIEQLYEIEKEALDFLQNNQRVIEIEKVKLEKDLESSNRFIEDLTLEIALKEKKKQKLTYYISLQDWIEQFFNPLMVNIERKVMLKLHTDFNALFQKWFSSLMNIDTIKVRLDEEFTPIIDQNGFDTEYENLSGGEKTACALAYRLSLNQIINSLLSSINANDLIILDEPTDGFSSDQLDRMRPVLEELDMKQIIIVSHENKIETFADNVIRIKKNNHVSSIG